MSTTKHCSATTVANLCSATTVANLCSATTVANLCSATTVANLCSATTVANLTIPFMFALSLKIYRQYFIYFYLFISTFAHNTY